MRSRWLHAPLLHTAHGRERKVTWLELFYDLIFVAAIIQLGDALSHHVTIGNFAAFAGHFVPLWIAWSGFTFFANRFDVDDFTHRIMVFIQMFAMGAMAISAPHAMEGHHTVFALCFTVAQVMVVAMYARAWYQVPKARDYCKYWGGAFAISAGLFLISAFVPTPWTYGFWVAGILAILGAPVSKVSRTLMERYPLDMEHLSERYGLLTIIVLGESFVKVLSYLSGSELATELEYVLKGSLGLLLTCTVWWIYFDDVAGSHLKKHRGAFEVWLVGHLPLAIAITGVGVAVKKAIKFDFSVPAPDDYRWLLAGTLCMTMASVAIIDSVTARREAFLSDRARVNVRFASAFIVLLLGQVGSKMSAGTFMALATTICVAQVLFDLMMAPMEAAEHSGDEPVSIAELARQKEAKQRSARDNRPRDVGKAIRKGAPAELRRDLYFFFLEGSWTRLLMSLLFVYVILNVFFAGLYLLEPGSISGTGSDSFAHAFFFSVQTMSTIGYGAMTPATSYGDLIVTIEAAAGLLGVAMATGMIFAKVSRPQASVLFSKVMVLTTRHGKRTLMLRAGNARGGEVADATVTLTVLKEEISAEGHHMRMLHDMKLVRARTPMFAMSWSIFHEIDEDSPLYDVNWDDPDEHIMMFVVTLMGHDGTYGQTTFSRHLYYPEDVRVGERFVDVISQLEDGRLMVDYHKFHDTVPDAEAGETQAGS
jgi:low temperature requirement protein LtrA